MYLFISNIKLRYFIVKSCNRENLELSVQQGVWATQRSNESKLNEAFDSAENVILIFSVNRTRHFQVGLQIKFQCVSRSLLFCSSIKLFQIHGFNLLEVFELKSPMLC